MTELSPADLTQTGPDTPFGRYLRRFWQPVACSEDVARGCIRHVEIMGEALAVYRGASGAAHAVGAFCRHRGARLCVGSVEAEDLRCLYHGWRFAPSGRCVEQPCDGADAPIKAAIAGYPTLEKYGLVFAYLGSGAPPPPITYASMEGDGFRRAARLDDWPCDFIVMVENAVDWSHTRFTHRRSGLADLLPDDLTYQGKETAFGVRVSATSPTRTALTEPTEFLMPNMNFFNIPLPSGRGSAWNVVWRVPVKDGVCASYLASFSPGDASLQAEAAAHLASFEGLNPTTAEIGERLLAGEIGWDHVSERPDLSRIEDYVTQVGQRPGLERIFAASDAPVRLLRSILLREARASEGGEPLKVWRQWADG